MYIYFALVLLSLNSTLYAVSFKLSDIPKGKEITLPNPASTEVSPFEPFHVAATDRGQTIKLSLEASSSKEKMRLAIYDTSLENAVYFNLSKNAPVVYSFKDMVKIRIVPKSVRKIRSLSKIKVESNRPLTIGH